MNSFVRIIGVAFLILFLGLILREMGFRGARLVTLLGTMGIMGVGISEIESVYKLLGDFGQGVSDDHVVTVMKILGIGYSSGICSDICLDFGEPTLSRAVVMLGRVEMLIISAPSAIGILERGVELIG